jgi:hypothetical protein
VVICVASLQKRLGLTKDEDFSEVWLTRGQFGSTFLDKLGLTGINDLLELSKCLSKIGAKIFESRGGLNFVHRSPPSLSSINTHLVPKLYTSSHFVCTSILFYLVFKEK